jgi:hypothetical protein
MHDGLARFRLALHRPFVRFRSAVLLDKRPGQLAKKFVQTKRSRAFGKERAHSVVEGVRGLEIC